MGRICSGVVAGAVMTLSVVAAAQAQPAACPAFSAGDGVADRVVGGSRAPIAQWPSFAAIRAVDDDETAAYFCGGSLIAPTWVLTAAHCFDRARRDAADGWEIAGTGGYDGRVELVFNTDDLADEQRMIVRRPARGPGGVVVHPEDPFGVNANDIALVRLDAPVDIPAMGLSPTLAADPDAGARALIAGFGAQGEHLHEDDVFVTRPTGRRGAAGSRSLLHALTPLVDGGRCVAAYPGVDPNTQLCAGFDAGAVDSCQGDSGGPLIAIDRGGCPYQIGVVNFGRGCARPSAYGVYARVSAFAAWIRGHVGDDCGGCFAPREPETSCAAARNAFDALVKRLEPARGRASITLYTGADLDTETTTFRVGDLMGLAFSSEVEGRLIVFDINAAGDVVQLYPNAWSRDGAIGRGTAIRLPALRQRDFNFRATPPYGDGFVIAVVTPPGFEFGVTAGAPARLDRGFAVEKAPSAVAYNLYEQVETAVAKPGAADAAEGLPGWALATTRYTISGGEAATPCAAP